VAGRLLGEALELRWDEKQQRWVYVYRTILEVIPRKNSKTTQSSAFSLYSAGPWEGEVRPQVLLAAGSSKQAGELWDHAVAFIDDPVGGSPSLAAEFNVFQSGITSKSTAGSVQRVAGDGKLNHSKNPSKVIADELHVWTTPRQIENWRALTTAGGARVSPQVYGLTTAGDDPTGCSRS
jgi:phage terminase large subunit-like protein